MARQILKSDKEKIDKMGKARLGNLIMRVNPRSAKFRYAVKKLRCKMRCDVCDKEKRDVS
jgi:hypothetical protein